MPLPSEFREMFSEDYRDRPWMEKYNSPDDFAKSFDEAQSLVGNSIRIPSEHAGEEDRKQFIEKLMSHAPDLMVKPNFSDPDQSGEFWRTLGKPEEADKYEISNDIKLDDALKSEMQQIAFESDMTTAQFKKWVSGMASRHSQSSEAAKSAFDQGMDGLKQEWGMTLEGRMEAAKRMNEKFYPGREFGSLDAQEIKSLYEISVSTTGKGPQATSQPGSPQGITPDEAREQAAEIMRRVHDRDADLSHAERMELMNKRINILKKYVPKYQEE